MVTLNVRFPVNETDSHDLNGLVFVGYSTYFIFVIASNHEEPTSG